MTPQERAEQLRQQLVSHCDMDDGWKAAALELIEASNASIHAAALQEAAQYIRELPGWVFACGGSEGAGERRRESMAEYVLKLSQPNTNKGKAECGRTLATMPARSTANMSMSSAPR